MISLRTSALISLRALTLIALRALALVALWTLSLICLRLFRSGLLIEQLRLSLLCGELSRCCELLGRRLFCRLLLRELLGGELLLGLERRNTIRPLPGLQDAIARAQELGAFPTAQTLH